MSDEKNTGWTYAPAPPDTHSYVDLGHHLVDGETFWIRRRDDGAHLYDWVSGPNPDYGFSMGGPAVEHFTPEFHEEAIRDFLSAIDPETGYMAD